MAGGPGDPLRSLILRWREDPGGTCRAWFLWEERLKNFRSIRTGLAQAAREIGAVARDPYLPAP